MHARLSQDFLFRGWGRASGTVHENNVNDSSGNQIGLCASTGRGLKSNNKRVKKCISLCFRSPPVFQRDKNYYRWETPWSRPVKVKRNNMFRVHLFEQNTEGKQKWQKQNKETNKKQNCFFFSFDDNQSIHKWKLSPCQTFKWTTSVFACRMEMFTI